MAGTVRFSLLYIYLFALSAEDFYTRVKLYPTCTGHRVGKQPRQATCSGKG